MKITFGYQLSDFDPEISEKKELDLDAKDAVELYKNFSWDEEFETLAERVENGLQHTMPSIQFFKSDKEFLSISASSHSHYEILYLKDEQLKNVTIAENEIEPTKTQSVELFITAFFENRLSEVLNYNQLGLDETTPIELKINYKQSKLYRPFLLLAIPAIMLFLKGVDAQLGFVFFFGMTSLIFIALIPRLLLNRAYWNNDVGQVFRFDPKTKMVTMVKNQVSISFPKSEIQDCEHVISRSSVSDFEYLKFRWNEHHFVVTFLTLEPTLLLKILNIPFEKYEMIYPKLITSNQAEKERKRQQSSYEKSLSEFLTTYEAWENEKLEEVISKPDYYANYAVEAAKQIIEKRKSS